MRNLGSIGFKEFINEIKRVSPIEDVIEESGAEYALDRRGSGWIAGRKHDSLTVNGEDGRYVWYSRNESGDVFSWLKARGRLEFYQALEYLAQRAQIEMPRWPGSADPETVSESRKRGDTWTTAAWVMAGWLKGDEGAWDYVTRGRGFSHETIGKGLLGFTGRETRQARSAMTAAFRAAEIDPESPAAVAICGYSGDVAGWAQHWRVDASSKWIQDGYIGGLLANRRLVYPHLVNGSVRYFSARNLPGFDTDKNTGKPRKSYNLPSELAGKRQLYFNQAWSKSAPSVVIVEGPGDANALGQLGQAAVALLGVNEDDLEQELKDLRTYKAKDGSQVERTFYLGTDGDMAGQSMLQGKDNDWPVVRLYGPMARVISWMNDNQHRVFDGMDGEQHKVKDANDYLNSLRQCNYDDNQQAVILRTQIMDQASPLVYVVAVWAGMQKGVEGEKAQRFAVGVIAAMDEFERAQYRARLVVALHLSARELDLMVRKVKEEGKGANGSETPTVMTIGGQIGGGWLLEYLYDVESHTSSLAWRDPDGKIGTGESVMIDGTRYQAEDPVDIMRDGGILMPSAVGPSKTTRELVTYIEFFIRGAYLLNKDTDAKIMAYYALLTWLYDAFNAIPYLRAMGEAGAGKSELMSRVGLVCYRLMRSSGAGSSASLFRSVEHYRGTVLIDEADLKDSSTSNDVVKFLNLGAMRNNPIWRMEEDFSQEGQKKFSLKTYQTFCPKLIAMRKDFFDDAVGSRCITFKVQPRETMELVAAGITLSINNEMRSKALALRNMLLRWRLENWQNEIEVDPAFLDFDISSRLNQVTGPLMAIAKDDPELRNEMKMFLRAYYKETILNRSMSLVARVIEAIWKIYKYPDLLAIGLQKRANGEEWIKIGKVTEVTNQIINEMNMGEEIEPTAPDPSDKKKRAGDEVKSQKIGRIIREDLQLQVSDRTAEGYWVVWDGARLAALAKRYGVDPSQFGPKKTGQVKETASGQRSAVPSRQSAQGAEAASVQPEVPEDPPPMDAEQYGIF